MLDMAVIDIPLNMSQGNSKLMKLRTRLAQSLEILFTIFNPSLIK